MRRLTTLFGLIALLALAGAATAAAPAGPAQMISWLNAQREANGIPGGITENPYYSEGCRLHEVYMKTNDYFGHPEDSSKEAYTAQGNDAGTNSVLASGSLWNGQNPWETAPIHLAQMLAPSLVTMGAWQQNNFVCASTWPGYDRQAPADNAVLSYPGDGTTGIYYSEQAAESPFVPGDLVGLPQGTTTGPHLYVYVWGPWTKEWRGVRVAAASLAGPDGQSLEVRTVDRDSDKIGPYLPPGSAILIPVAPLKPATTYRASVTMSYRGQTVSHDWSFTTMEAPKPPKPRNGGGSSSDGGNGLRANHVRVVVRPAGRGLYWAIVVTPASSAKGVLRSSGHDQPVELSRTHGAWSSRPFKAAPSDQFCVISGGARSGYSAVSYCAPVR
jgi:hypothetical protein